MQQDTSTLLPGLLALAWQATDKVMAIYNSGDLGIETKADESPVTRADIAANDIIGAGLKTLTPDIPVISEEALLPDVVRLASDSVWLVDPIDGTYEFIQHNGQFTINIALVEHGEPVLGLQAVPAEGWIYYGAKGIGAFRVRKDGDPEQLSAEGTGPIKAVVRSTQPDEAQTKWLKDHDIHETEVVGASLKFCRLVDGTYDVYPRPSQQMEWDCAAGDAILRATGGSTLEWGTDKPLAYNKPDLHVPPYIASGKRLLANL
jgi:3'(2'), 5'-bisphosphate nucleotidase